MKASLSKWWLDRTAVNLAWLLASLALSGVACNTRQNPPTPDRAFAAVRQALDNGSYAEAERQASALKIEFETPPRGVERALAVDLLIEALVRNGKAAEPATLALAEQGVELKNRLRLNSLDQARSLELLGYVYNERGEFTRAVPQHERALTIRRQQLGAKHPLVADSLDHLARALIRLERFTDARQSLDQSVAIRTAVKDDPLAQARTFELLGMLRRYEGAYPIALEALRQALDLHERFAPEHPDLASILHARGDLLWLQGKIDEGRRSWVDALTHAEKTLGTAHPSAAPILRKLALAAAAAGDLAEGRRLRERGFKISEASFAPCHPERSNYLSDLALSLIHDGEYPEAQKTYDQALALYRNCLGDRHSLVATAIYNQADLAAKMGDFNEAERLYQSAIDLWSSVLGSGHPYVARAIDGLAEIHAKRGDYRRAESLYSRALTIRRASGDRNHPDIAWTLTNMARALADSGNLQRAFAYASEAVDIYKRAGAADEPDHLSRALELRAVLELRLGRGTSAKASIAEALDLRRKIFGASHPLTAGTLVQLASIQLSSAERGRALATALAAEEASRDHLQFTIRYLPERQAMAYADARSRGLDLALAILVTGPDGTIAERVFNSVIHSRGVVLDEMAARARLLANAEPSASPAIKELHNTRQRYANLVLRSLQLDDKVSVEALESARRNKERAERAAADLGADAGGKRTHFNIGVAEVRHALPKHSALVSFVRYTSAPADFGSSSATPKAGYVAFVMRSEASDVFFKDLGSADVIDGLVVKWRTQITKLSSEADVRATGARLQGQIWAPVTEYINGASRVFIVPDGSLSLVNFAALPSRSERYLIEDSPPLHYLSTERDLLIAASGDSVKGLLAVGGPEFSESVPSTENTRAFVAGHMSTARVTRQTICAGTSLQFQPLAGTTQEVSELSRLWFHLGRSPTTTLTGRTATEKAVRTSVTGRAVIHFATHGFFLGSACTFALPATRAVAGLSVGIATIRSAGSENSLARAGLAFAGANRHASLQNAGDDDGILTGEEIAGLNLQGTQWAVLSACDTGIGEVKAGEGVVGLRRAFQIAGARTVIMSLWSVEDQATRDWMLSLYRSRLSENLDTPSAMRAASLSVLGARRAKQLSTHPFYWAAFVAAGDWR